MFSDSQCVVSFDVLLNLFLGWVLGLMVVEVCCVVKYSSFHASRWGVSLVDMVVWVSWVFGFLFIV